MSSCAIPAAYAAPIPSLRYLATVCCPFRDGDDLLVEYTPEINPGEIGIFIVAGEGFVKEYQPDGLHSHNARYKTIHPTPDDNFRCIGRVLGIVTEDMLPTPRELDVLNEVYSTKHEH